MTALATFGQVVVGSLGGASGKGRPFGTFIWRRTRVLAAFGKTTTSGVMTSPHHYFW